MEQTNQGSWGLGGGGGGGETAQILLLNNTGVHSLICVTELSLSLPFTCTHRHACVPYTCTQSLPLTSLSLKASGVHNKHLLNRPFSFLFFCCCFFTYQNQIIVIHKVLKIPHFLPGNGTMGRCGGGGGGFTLWVALGSCWSAISILCTHQDAVASICELGLKEQYDRGRLSPIWLQSFVIDWNIKMSS